MLRPLPVLAPRARLLRAIPLHMTFVATFVANDVFAAGRSTTCIARDAGKLIELHLFLAALLCQAQGLSFVRFPLDLAFGACLFAGFSASLTNECFCAGWVILVILVLSVSRLRLAVVGIGRRLVRIVLLL